MKTKMILAVFAALLTAGCSSDEKFTSADGKVLCDPSNGDAYLIEHRALDVSFVERNENFNKLCEGFNQ